MLLISLIPLCGGLLIAALRLQSNRARNILMEVITCLTSLCVLRLILAGGDRIVPFQFTETYAFAFACDGAAKVLLAVIALLWPLAILYATEYMEHEERENTFFCFYIMTYGVMILLCCANNLFTLYCMIEMLTLVTLPLVWHKKDPISIRSARTYVKYSIGCAAFLFISMVLIYAYGGGDFALASTKLSRMPLPLMQMTFIMGFFGFGVKATVFPLSAWLPKACAAPTPVTALLHAVAVVNAGIFAVLRLIYYVYDPALLHGTFAQTVALTASILTILWGAVMAVRERHVKRKLAFSTVSNLGYMLFGLSLMTCGGMVAGMMHMICHSLMKILLFFCIGAVMCRTERTQMTEMHGMAKVMPVTFFAFTFGAIALMGIPPLAGFASKFCLLSEGIASGTALGYVGAAALLVSAVLTSVYTLSTAIPAYVMKLEKKEELPSDHCDPSWRMLMPLIVLMILITVVGIHPMPILEALRAVSGATGL